MDAAEALDEALVNLRAVIEGSGAAVTAGPLPRVWANQAQLVRVFQNLVSNAVKFCGKNAPRIRIEAGQEAGDPLFRVRDNGIGIDPAYHDRVFTLFKRLHTGAAYPGAGIGLAVCKRIVERHGGRIWLVSAPGEGTTVCFTLPARPAEGADASAGERESGR